MLKIGNVSIRKGKTVIIAEAGVNHNGKMHFAKKLVDEAKKAGADIIKFQTYKASNLTTQKAPRFLILFIELSLTKFSLNPNSSTR